MNAPLNLGNGGSPFASSSGPLAGFDNAPSFDGFDLSGFDRADGKLVLPIGVYICRIVRGELTTTRAGLPAYRLRLVTVEPSEHAGFTLWQYYMLTDAVGFNKAANALRPLGFTSSDDLRKPYPPIGKDVFVKALVTPRPAKNGYPEGNNVERFEPCDPPAGAIAQPNPFAVPLDAKEGGSA